MDQIIEVTVQGHYFECGEDTIYTNASIEAIKRLEQKVPNVEKLSKKRGRQLAYEEVPWYTIEDFIEDLKKEGYLVFECNYSEIITLD